MEGSSDQPVPLGQAPSGPEKGAASFAFPLSWRVEVGRGEAPACPRGARSLPTPQETAATDPNQKCKSACLCQSSNLAPHRGQTKQSPQDKGLCPQGCPAPGSWETTEA